VRVAFWKEQPSIADALDEVDAEHVIVVPYFMANGWFVTEALPAALGLKHWPELRAEKVGGKQVAYTHAVGAHDSVHEMVQALATEALGDRPADDVAIAIVGHGSSRSTTSRFSAISAGDALRATNHFAEVVNVFLDDEPEVASIFETWSSDVVVVPFMVSDGPHVRVDLVREMGLDSMPEFGEAVATRDKTVRFTEPVGASRQLMGALRSRIEEARVALGAANGMALTPCSDALGSLVAQARRSPVTVGNLVIDAQDDDWVVSRVGDEMPSEELSELPDRAPWRWWRRNTAGGYRPWLSGTDAPDGWIVRGTELAALGDLLAVLAPGALMAWNRAEAGRLEPASFAALAAQQKGPTRAARGFALEDLDELVGGICHNCARKVVWRASKGIAAPRGGAALAPACETPCLRLFSEAARRVRSKSG
jgi:sirohydrochlorin cobaltochelatase